MNRVKLVEKEREGLEGEKMAAEAYLHKDAERLGTQSKIFQRFMSDGQVRNSRPALLRLALHTTRKDPRYTNMLMPRYAKMLMPRYAKQDLAAIHV